MMFSWRFFSWIWRKSNVNSVLGWTKSMRKTPVALKQPKNVLPRIYEWLVYYFMWWQSWLHIMLSWLEALLKVDEHSFFSLCTFSTYLFLQYQRASLCTSIAHLWSKWGTLYFVIYRSFYALSKKFTVPILFFILICRFSMYVNAAD